MQSILILDGYTDEPSALGVPPYIGPLPRYLAGAVKDFDPSIEVEYTTIDAFRHKYKISQKGPGRGRRGRSASASFGRAHDFLKGFDIVVIISGFIVPGRYLVASPISGKEISGICDTATGQVLIVGAAADIPGPGYLPGNAMAIGSDGDAALFDLLEKGSPSTLPSCRRRTLGEWGLWTGKGAFIVERHPGFPDHIIAELEPMRGCVRRISGGCSFCAEPGRPLQFRTPGDVIKEAAALRERGIRNFRLGGSDIFSYFAHGAGEVERPEPNRDAVEELLGGIAAMGPGVFHLDNANPALIAGSPGKSEAVLRLIVKYCTPGNSLSLGLESADPAVKEANNLNASAEEVFTAVRMINATGCERGGNGLPMLLPGLNFLAGLKGETPRTHEINMRFLQRIVDGGLLLRRINIRQVVDHSVMKAAKGRTTQSVGRVRRERSGGFTEFKRHVRENVDRIMLHRLLPYGTIMRSVYFEKRDGGVSFGRQIGTYPVLVGVPYPIETGTIADVRIFDWGPRSVTGFVYPFDLNTATLKEISALPGLGKKRAVRVIAGRPYGNPDDFARALDDENVGKDVWEFTGAGRVRGRSRGESSR